MRGAGKGTGVSGLFSRGGRVDMFKSDRVKEEFERIIFGEDLDHQTTRLRAKSPYQNLRSWKLAHIFIKSGDDLKQEQFALQLIQ